MKNEKNNHEMNFIPNKHELYLFNRGNFRKGKRERRERERNFV